MFIKQCAFGVLAFGSLMSAPAQADGNVIANDGPWTIQRFAEGCTASTRSTAGTAYTFMQPSADLASFRLMLDNEQWSSLTINQTYPIEVEISGRKRSGYGLVRDWKGSKALTIYLKPGDINNIANGGRLIVTFNGDTLADLPSFSDTRQALMDMGYCTAGNRDPFARH